MCMYPVLAAQFVLVDDHGILMYSLPGAGPPLDSLGAGIFSADLPIGRFRPMAWLVRLTEITLLGDNPSAWHALALGIGITAASLLYFTWRNLGFNRSLSFLLGAWLLVAPGVSSAWVRLGPNETSGMLLFTLAICTATLAARTTRAAAVWDTLFIVSALAAVLSKESFVLTAPALAGFRVLAGFLVTGQMRLTRPPVSSVCVLVLGVCAGIAEALISHAAGTSTYGGGFLARPDPGPFTRFLAQNLAILVHAGVGWLALVLLWRMRRHRYSMHDRDTGLLAAGLAALLVLPQLLVYSNQGVLEGRYELPAALGVVGLLTLGLAWVHQRGAHQLYRLSTSIFGAVLVAFGFSTWTYASFFAADSVQLHRLITEVASKNPSGSTLAIAADPGRQYEPILSLLTHLARYGPSDAQVEVLQLVPPDLTYTPREESLVQDLRDRSLLHSRKLSDEGCANLSAVIVLGNELLAHNALPCLMQGFRREEFSASVLLWGGEGVSLRPRVPGIAQIAYVLLLPQPNGQSQARTLP
jgi:hypothetical protein